MRRCVAAIAATLLVASSAVGCGGNSTGGAKGLGWVHEPRLIRYPTLPNDRATSGEVRNDSERALQLDARKVRLLDAQGRGIAATVTARFLAGFAHGLYSPTQFGPVRNPFELQRLGVKVVLAPKQVRPLTVAWRLKPGLPAPARVDYGAGSLPLPKG